MNRNQTSSPSSSRKPLSANGLILNGVVIDRTRRHVPKDNPSTEIVTYTLSDNTDRKFYVDDFAPTTYHELGDVISIPVYVKPYIKKNSDAAYNLCVQKKTTTRGEHF